MRLFGVRDFERDTFVHHSTRCREVSAHNSDFSRSFIAHFFSLPILISSLNPLDKWPLIYDVINPLQNLATYPLFHSEL